MPLKALGDGLLLGIPAFGIHTVEATELQVTGFDLVRKHVDEAAIFPVEEAARGRGINQRASPGVAEEQQFHVALQIWAEPAVIFALHKKEEEKGHRDHKGDTKSTKRK